MVLSPFFRSDSRSLQKGQHPEAPPDKDANTRVMLDFGQRRPTTIYVSTAVEARKLEHGLLQPQTKGRRNTRYEHKSSYIHVPTFWSLPHSTSISLQAGPGTVLWQAGEPSAP